MSRLVFAVIALAMLPEPLLAQERSLAPGAGTPVVFLEPEGKNPRTAFKLSLWSTLIPTVAGAVVWYPAMTGSDSYGESSGWIAGLGLTGLGVLAGPATGYFYGGAAGRGLLGIGIRAATGGVVVLTADGSPGLAGAAGAVAVVSAIWDIVAVQGTVAARAAKGPQVTVVPYMGPHGAPGVAGHIAF